MPPSLITIVIHLLQPNSCESYNVDERQNLLKLICSALELRSPFTLLRALTRTDRQLSRAFHKVTILPYRLL